ncbi:ankyrin repeat domain-containing protein [bacterium]|nr:MAG: ankyrin repeat domain-containing protein [bacterium]
MRNPIFDAILRRNRMAVTLLARFGANLRAKIDIDEGHIYQSMTPLMVASGAPGEMAGIVEALLQAGADPNEASFSEFGPLHYAAMGRWPVPGEEFSPHAQGDFAARLRLLLTAGGDPNRATSHGRNPLGEAAAGGDPERVRILLEAGAWPNLPPGDWSGGNEWNVDRTDFAVPLFRAASGGSPECVRLLLKAGADAAYEDRAGRSALAFAANGDSARLLIEAGADPRDPKAWFQALGWKRFDVAEALLEKGLDPNRRDGEGGLLHQAVLKRSAEGVRLLLRYGADRLVRTSDGRSPLHWAAGKGDWKTYPPRPRDEETLRVLLDSGFDPDERDGMGRTPLHEAASGSWGGVEVTRALLERGAKPDEADENGITPLMVAVEEGNSERVRLFLQAGADPHRVANDGRSVEDFALENLDFCQETVDSPDEDNYDDDLERHLDNLEEASRALTMVRGAL